jgi:hypothetical protein
VYQQAQVKNKEKDGFGIKLPVTGWRLLHIREILVNSAFQFMLEIGICTYKFGGYHFLDFIRGARYRLKRKAMIFSQMQMN